MRRAALFGEGRLLPAALRRLAPAGTAGVSVAICVLLLLGVLLSYSGVTDNDFVSFDDPVYLTQNPMVSQGLTWAGIRWAFTTTHAANWHPLTWLSHMLDVQLFGLDPGRHHAAGLALHAANALLLYLLLLRLTGAPWRSGLVAALFAVHPLHVESVAWASERKDLLSTFLALLTLLAWRRHLARPGAGRLAGVCVLFALALLAKPMPVTLPFVMLLLDWWPFGRWAPGPSALWRVLPPAQLWREKLPLFLLAAASSVATYLAQRAGGAVIPGTHISLGYRVVNALMNFEAYLEKAVWPSDLSFYYRLPPSMPAWWLAAILLLLGGVALLVLRAARRRPWLGVGLLWYLGTLVPVIGLVQVGGQAMADRYTYVPLTGIFLMVAWSLGELAARRRGARAAVVAAAVAVLVVFGALTRDQVALWRDDQTVSAHSLSLDPDNWMGHTVLGIGFVRERKHAEALVHLKEALRINPGAEEHYNLGVVYDEMGEDETALGHYREAIALKPDYVDAHAQLGKLLLERGELDEAVSRLSEAVRLDPYRPTVRADLAAALGRQGLIEEAVEHYRAARELDPGQPGHPNDLGRLLAANGRDEEALQAFRATLEIDPKSVAARNNLGNVLLKLGRIEAAIAYYQEALALEPGTAETHFNLGDAYSALRDLDGAVRHYEVFLAARPDHVNGNFHLANVLAAQGKFAEAIARYRRVVSLDPAFADGHFNLGNALLDTGRPAEAVEPFLQALRLRPEDPDYAARLGDAYARIGRLDEAAGAYRSALARAPGHPVALQGLERLPPGPGRGAPRPAAP